jgi:DNA (cytosine-5)-methyltransferase 1
VRFYDAFAGIGGIRIAMESAGFKCVGGCEVDKHARYTYALNFGRGPGDRDICDVGSLPVKTSVLCAGFPCTPFSCLGARKGLSDTKKGRLFFELVRLLNQSKPEALLFENVKGLVSIDKGRILRRIINDLEGEGYHISFKVLNAADFGLAQKRERIFIVGFRSHIFSQRFEFPSGHNVNNVLSSIVERDVGSEYFATMSMLTTYIRKLKSRGPGCGGRFLQFLHTPEEQSNTLVTNGDMLLLIDNKRIRRFTPREWARLQGFPEWFCVPKFRTVAYRQIGNSVPVPVVSAIAEKMAFAMNLEKSFDEMIDLYEREVK